MGPGAGGVLRRHRGHRHDRGRQRDRADQARHRRPSLLGAIHICGEDGAELPPGEIGEVYFESETWSFAYHNDPEKTKAAQHPDHANWTSLGDIGYLDDDGFLFLTDRKPFMIISGGVNIYPQETENVLALHPAIHDVAVIGVPDPDMGESVKAFVQPAPGPARPGTGEEIIAFVKSHIASFKAPRSVQFVDDLPRTEAIAASTSSAIVKLAFDIARPERLQFDSYD